MIATAGMLIIVFITSVKSNVLRNSLGYSLGVLYLIILAVTVLAFIVAIPLGSVRNTKRNGVKKFLISTLLYFFAGAVLAVVGSLIKYRTYFSLNASYIPIASALIPSITIFFEKDKT